jgi:SepF-like predicted cell division protein (DUF552 family)
LLNSDDSINAGAREKINETKESKKSGDVSEKLQIPNSSKVYLKALPLKDLDDVDVFKREVMSGNILILKVSPLARKSIDDVKTAVGALSEFVRLNGGDIARLGEERVVITPNFIQIWRGKRAI